MNTGFLDIYIVYSWRSKIYREICQHDIDSLTLPLLYSKHILDNEWWKLKLVTNWRAWLRIRHEVEKGTNITSDASIYCYPIKMPFEMQKYAAHVVLSKCTKRQHEVHFMQKCAMVKEVKFSSTARAFTLRLYSKTREKRAKKDEYEK